MKTAGIVCEYNPLHNGHLYQIEQTRKMGTTHIVAIMSGNYVQRGELAIIDKHYRAKMAINAGADLVVELPVPFSIASAEIFAKSAIYILDSLGVADTLSFGSESGNIELLRLAANASEKIANSSEFKKLIANGISYPSAIYSLISEKYKAEISNCFLSPNNTLAIEYIKALNHFNSSIIPTTIKRTMVEHDSEHTDSNFSSASNIRKMLFSEKDVQRFIPNECTTLLNDFKDKYGLISINSIEKIILYKLLSMTNEELANIPDANNGLSNRLYDACRKSNTLEELLSMTKTKCFTMARIRRVITYALLGITKQDLDTLPPYGRILAFNNKGCEILSEAKDVSKIPFSTSLSDLSKTNKFAKRIANLDEISSKIYYLASDNPNNENEYSKKITI